MKRTSEEQIRKNIKQLYSEESISAVLADFEKNDYDIEKFSKLGCIAKIEDLKLRHEIGEYCLRKLYDGFWRYIPKTDIVIVTGEEGDKAFKSDGTSVDLPKGITFDIYFVNYMFHGLLPVKYKTDEGKYGLMTSSLELVLPLIFDDISFDDLGVLSMRLGCVEYTGVRVLPNDRDWKRSVVILIDDIRSLNVDFIDFCYPERIRHSADCCGVSEGVPKITIEQKLNDIERLCRCVPQTFLDVDKIVKKIVSKEDVSNDYLTKITERLRKVSATKKVGFS